MSLLPACRNECIAADARDPLAPLRARFALPEGVIYLDGNSLGALPAATPGRVEQVLREQWGRDLITSWNRHGWIEAPQRVGDKIARLIGAAPDEVIACDSTSVNLAKLIAAALASNPGRGVIVSDADNFPTDLYVAQGLAGLLGEGCSLRAVPRGELAAAIDADTALVMLTEVDYRSGEKLDMAGLTALAQTRGARVLWDLAHSAGAFPVALDACNADFAVGCGYKYLNGGPGAPAFLYVARRWQAQAGNFLSGWMGHAAPFAFDAEYRPAAGIRRFLVGTPPVVALAALEAGVDVLLEADAAALREKSLALTELFIARIDAFDPAWQLRLITPREPGRRGSQVALTHPQGHAIVQALIARGVIGDFRAPDLLRFGFAPLYLRHVDAWDAADALAEVMASEAWRDPRHQLRQAVT